MIVCIGILMFHLSKSRNFQVFWWLINNIQTDQNIIALTFDDGPTQNTYEILQTLRKHHIQATFFVIWEEIIKDPKLIKSIIEEGHQVGNHSYTHQRMVLKSPHFVKQEITKTDQLIKEAWFTGDIHFRTPFGKRLFITPYILRSFKKANIFFDIEPETFVSGSWNILSYTLEHTHSWSIILLHPMYWWKENQSLQILDTLIDWLKKRGFSFVTIDQLLEKTATSISFW